MEKKVVLFCSFLFAGEMVAFVEDEKLFNSDCLISYEQSLSGVPSNVRIVGGVEQFQAQVLNNKKPVVIKFFSEQQPNERMVRNVYQTLAESFKDKAIFVGISVGGNEAIVQAVMMRFGQPSVSLPLFVFFKNDELIYPQVKTLDDLYRAVRQYVCNDASGAPVAAMIKKVDRATVAQPTNVVPQSQSKKPVAQQQKEEQKNKATEPSIFEKIKKVFSGIQDLSKDVEAYTIARRWKQRRDMERCS